MKSALKSKFRSWRISHPNTRFVSLHRGPSHTTTATYTTTQTNQNSTTLTPSQSSQMATKIDNRKDHMMMNNKNHPLQEDDETKKMITE